MKKIAFIGIGNMGYHMAHNLSKAGFEVSVFDLNQDALAKASQDNMNPTNSVEECCKNAEVVVSMLPSSPHVESLYTNEQNGLLKILNKKTILIDCSTIAPNVSKKVSDLATTAGFQILDAPVSGGTAAAEAGTLTFMVGGNKDTLEKTRPLFEAMGAKLFHAGDSSCGQVAKVCNNMLLSIHMIGTSEALNLGQNCGLDPKVLSEIMLQSSGRNWSLEVYNPCPGVQESSAASRDYTGGFASQLMLKDIGLSQEAATATNSKTPLAAMAEKLYKEHVDAGDASKDFSSIFQKIKNSK